MAFTWTTFKTSCGASKVSIWNPRFASHWNVAQKFPYLLSLPKDRADWKTPKTGLRKACVFETTLYFLCSIVPRDFTLLLKPFVWSSLIWCLHLNHNVTTGFDTTNQNQRKLPCFSSLSLARLQRPFATRKAVEWGTSGRALKMVANLGLL